MKKFLVALALVAASASHADARMGLAAGQCLNKYHSPAERVQYCKSYAEDGQADPNHREAGEYSLAWAYRLAGDYANAETTMTDVIKLAPDWVNAWMERSTAYAEDGKYDLALADIEHLRTMTDDPALPAMQRCWVRGVIGRDLQPALQDCNDAMETYPTDFAVLMARALVNNKLGNTQAVLDDTTTAHQVRPNSAGALFLRGVAKGAAGADDIAAAKDLEPYIDVEFAGYGVKPVMGADK